MDVRANLAGFNHAIDFFVVKKVFHFRLPERRQASLRADRVATQCPSANANFAVDLVKLFDGSEPPSHTLLDQISHEHHHDR